MSEGRSAAAIAFASTYRPTMASVSSVKLSSEAFANLLKWTDCEGERAVLKLVQEIAKTSRGRDAA